MKSGGESYLSIIERMVQHPAQLNWEAAPCREGKARSTMPQIPHGAQPRYAGMKKRRTILPWLSRVAEDQTTLPDTNKGAETVQDVALARIACMPPKATQSGKPIYNSDIPYKYPACVRLESLGASSDTLIGLRQWDAPEVISEQEILFGEDRSAALGIISAWRAKACTAAHVAFDVIKKTEQGIFLSKLYWNKQAADYPFD